MSERALLFTSGGLTLALPARLGRETFLPQHLLPLPGGQASLLGMTEVRGRAVPLLNLPALLGRAVTDTRTALALLIEVRGDLLALPVQEVIGVVSTEALPTGPELLSEPFWSGQHHACTLNAELLVSAVRSRITAA